MPFEITLPTRHTDAFAGTGFVHAGVLLALTELAYAAFEERSGVVKPEHVYAVQRATEVTYRAPLGWREGATLRVRTLETSDRGFDQEYEILSARDGRCIARVVHRWVWLDTRTGRRVELSAEDQAGLAGSG